MRLSTHTHQSLSYALAFFAGVFLVGISYTFAATDTPNPAERRAALENVVQERLINLASNITLRLNAATERLGNIIARLETRIAKLKGFGIDTSTAENRLATAKEILVRTVILLEGIEPTKNAVSSETPRESFQSIRSEFTAVRDNLKQIREILREVVVLLKESVASSELGQGVNSAVSDSVPQAEIPAPVE